MLLQIAGRSKQCWQCKLYKAELAAGGTPWVHMLELGDCLTDFNQI
jgi:hypothetical protein